MTKDNDFGTAKLSRRDFLKLAANTGGVLILAACAPSVVGPIMPIPDGAPGSPTPTQPSPTETATPTETPTPSPESLLPVEVKEKFEQAGIDLADMENTKYDKDGLHITLPGGEVIVLTNTDLEKGMYNGQDNVLQYRDEANQNVIYAFDPENKTFLEASKYIQKDSKNIEGYIIVENWDELKSIWAKEKMFLIPFDPEKTYFPPSDKIKRDYDNWENPEWSSEYNYSMPFGVVPEGMESPFRSANYVIMREFTDSGKPILTYNISQQVFNPDDDSFSVLHFVRGNYNALFKDIQEALASNTFMLPYLKLNAERLTHPALNTLVNYLKLNGLIENNGNMPIVQNLVSEWFDNRHVPIKLESIPLDFRLGYIRK